VLTTVAVVMFNKQSNKAKASEVPAVFAELKLREEQFRLEHDEYLATAADDNLTFPTADPGNTAVALDLTTSSAPPAPQDTDYPGPAWQTLRFASDKSALYCGYSVTVGAGGDGTNIGTIAGDDPIKLDSTTPLPATDWFYLVALCDFDGDDVNATYFTLSNSEAKIVLNAGE
jgi:hypothetical protein